MKIRSSLGSGFVRALKSWKGVLLLWLVSVILVSLLVIPFRGELRNALGSSMITGNLADGFDLLTFMELGQTLKNMMASFSSDFLFVILISFITNAFLSGGLFDSLRNGKVNFSTAEFFSAGSKNFWSFISISLVITLTTIILSLIIIGITAVIIASSGSFSEKSGFIYMSVSFLVILLLLPVFILAADYARAWKVLNGKATGFQALGFGFRLTFARFWSSYAMMLILIFCQLVFSALIFYLITVWKPVTEKEVLLLFIVTQLLVYARLLLKTWRYGSVTTFMEK